MKHYILIVEDLVDDSFYNYDFTDQDVIIGGVGAVLLLFFTIYLSYRQKD